MSLFKDQFYVIVDALKSASVFSFTIRLNASHAIFEGHFPGNPVTPGVVQLEMIKELLSEALGKPVRLESLSNCKYLAVINPLTCGDLVVNIDCTSLDNGSFKALVTLKNDETTFLKASGIYC